MGQHGVELPALGNTPAISVTSAALWRKERQKRNFWVRTASRTRLEAMLMSQVLTLQSPRKLARPFQALRKQSWVMVSARS